VGAFLTIRTGVLAQSIPATTTGSSPSDGMFLALKIYLTSIGQWFWPSDLSVDHAWSFSPGPTEKMMIAAGTVTAIMATIFLTRVNRTIGWCLVWCWVALIPLGALPFVSRFTLYQEHRTYLAGIALACIIGGVGTRVWDWASERGTRLIPSLLALGAIIITLVAIRIDWHQTVVWTDASRLWDHVLTDHPQSLLAHNSKGILMREAGNLHEARRIFQRAIDLNPGSTQSHNNLGAVLVELNEPERALLEFQISLAIVPTDSAAWLGLGQTYEHLKQPDRAIAAYKELLRNDPKNAEASCRIGAVHAQERRWTDAAEWYERALTHDPRHFICHIGLALVSERMGDNGRATVHYRAFLDTVPQTELYESGRRKAREALMRLQATP
jgi:Tfp pilus assembly protein PilF